MKTWFDDPKQLINADKVLEFWPTGEQTPEDRVNAASRFVIYTCCILYLTRRDPRIFVLGLAILTLIIALYKSNMVNEKYSEGCKLPTDENPMGNVLIGDAPNRLEACYYATANQKIGNQIPFDAGRSRSPLPKYQRNSVDRQFVTNPVTTVPGNQTAFAEWLYGPKNGPMCKSDTRFCDPNARGVQLEAFGGLNDGNKRGGMFGPA